MIAITRAGDAHDEAPDRLDATFELGLRAARRRRPPRLRRSSRCRMLMPTAVRRTTNATSAATAISPSWSVISTDAGRSGSSSMAGMVATATLGTEGCATAVLPGAAEFGQPPY